MGKERHILQIVIKNTSTMDYTLPLLWGIRQNNPNTKLTILYCVADKRQIIRDSKYIDKFCDENSVNQYDFTDFIKPKFKFFTPLWRKLFSKSYSDQLSLRSFLYKNKEISKIELIDTLLSRLLKLIEYNLGRVLIDVNNILPKLDADFVLFDNRTTTTFYGREKFYRYFEETKIPIALLPHAPHYNSPTDEFCKFDEQNENPLPQYTEHWMPFEFAEPWLVTPSHRDQFIKVGYPGLDSNWITHQMKSKDTKKNGELKCLILTRKFLSKGAIRPDNCDPFTLDYDEVLHALQDMVNAASKCSISVKFIIKPHPSGSSIENQKILQDSGMKNYEVTYESFYKLLPNIDFEISQFSTSLMLPVVYGIPTIVVNSSVQEYIHNQWSVVKDMYLGLNFFTKDYMDLEENFIEIVDILKEKKNNMKVKEDMKFMRQYAMDNGINNCIERINKVLNSNLVTVQE